MGSPEVFSDGRWALDLGAEAPVQMQLMSIAAAGAIAELLLAWTQGRLQASRDELVDYLTSLYELAARAAATTDGK